MNELAKSIAELINTLNHGASGIGDAAKKFAPDMWRMAVYQAKVDAITGCVAWTAFAVLVLVVSLKFASNQRVNLEWLSEEQKLSEDLRRHNFMVNCEGAAEGWQIGKWIARCLAVVVILISTSSYLPTILNPEYAAASQLSALFLGK